MISGWRFLMGAAALLMTGEAFAQYGSVACESRNNGYRECYTGFRGPPVMVRRLSDSPCIEGRNWGHRPGSVWVSQGCRAVFEEARGGPVWGGDTVLCESVQGRRNECRTPFRGPVELVEQLSRSACVEGRTWGRTRGGVWVDGGCRARFAAYHAGGGGGGYWQPSGGYAIECESRDGRYRACAWDWGRGTPFLLEQLSRSPCVRGRSWGYDPRQRVLWVDQGCRAVFGPR